jgi:hypothetical protein
LLPGKYHVFVKVLAERRSVNGVVAEPVEKVLERITSKKEKFEKLIRVGLVI